MTVLIIVTDSAPYEGEKAPVDIKADQGNLIDGDDDDGYREEPVEVPEDRGAVILFRGVEFPRATMPGQILAMARPPKDAPPVPESGGAPKG